MHKHRKLTQRIWESSEVDQVSLRDRMLQLGWKDAWFDRGMIYARIGRNGFEPFSRLSRIMSSSRSLPVPVVIPIGSRIKFSSALKNLVVNPSFTLASIVFHPIGAVVSRLLLNLIPKDERAKLLVKPNFELELDSADNLPFSKFPFDDYLIVARYVGSTMLLVDKNWNYWRIPDMSLTYITHIVLIPAKQEYGFADIAPL